MGGMRHVPCSEQLIEFARAGIKSKVILIATSEGKLIGLELFFIDQAEFNEDVGRSTFRLAVPANTKVFLYEKPDLRRPKRNFIVTEDVAHLAEYIRERG